MIIDNKVIDCDSTCGTPPPTPHMTHSGLKALVACQSYELMGAFPTLGLYHASSKIGMVGFNG